MTNTFKSYGANLVSSGNTTVYTTPAGKTAILILAQAVNINTASANVTLLTSINGNTELIKNFTIPANDAASLITGKLVIEESQSLYAVASSNGQLKLTISLLESTNS